MIGYFDSLIDARQAGVVSDHVHLGLGAEPSLEAAQEAMARRHLDLLALQDGQTVVDVGCGFGGTLRLVDRGQSGMRLVGVNIDPRQIALAAEGAWRNPVDWQLCDAAAFSPSTEWADRILSLEAMFHFPDPQGFLTACARALRPGGRVVISTILLPTAPGWSGSVAVVTEGFAPWPHPALDLPTLRAMAERAGLVVVVEQDLAALCVPAFDWISGPCPPQVTANPVTELRRMFQAGVARYPLLVLEPYAGGKTQK